MGKIFATLNKPGWLEKITRLAKKIDVLFPHVKKDEKSVKKQTFFIRIVCTDRSVEGSFTMRGRMKAEEAALILIKISHIDRTLLLLPFWPVFENIKRNAP